MTSDLTELLHQGHHSLVVRQGMAVRCFDSRGVADLHSLLSQEPQLLRRATVADKVVGKAAASLMMLGGVSELYADVISDLALEVLQQSPMAVHYTQRVDHIINRTRTGWCPMETRCRECHTAEECLRQVEEFLRATKSLKD